MLKQKNPSKRGFTIIEVVLVLAIAGLIFLMVFLALPALQRSQRDTQRRNLLGEFRTQIVQYQSNNRGRLPGASTSSSNDLREAWNNFVIDYLDLGKVKKVDNGGEEDNDAYFESEKEGEDIPFVDPDGAPIYIKQACILDPSTTDSSCQGNESLSWDTNKHQIYVYMHATCEGENAVPVENASTRLVAFRYKLEGAGTYCGNN